MEYLTVSQQRSAQTHQLSLSYRELPTVLLQLGLQLPIQTADLRRRAAHTDLHCNMMLTVTAVTVQKMKRTVSFMFVFSRAAHTSSSLQLLNGSRLYLQTHLSVTTQCTQLFLSR